LLRPLVASLIETLLLLDVLQDLEIHAWDGRVMCNVAKNRDGVFEERGEGEFSEPSVA
jgi:hypothetical protein